MRGLCAAALLVCAGCATSGGARVTLISSTPEGALVTIEGYGECEAPCRVSIDGPRVVTVAKAGFLPQRFEIRPGRKRIDVALELAAPTEGVDSTALPEL